MDGKDMCGELWSRFISLRIVSGGASINANVI